MAQLQNAKHTPPAHNSARRRVITENAKGTGRTEVLDMQLSPIFTELERSSYNWRERVDKPKHRSSPNGPQQFLCDTTNCLREQ
ncbi:uncharacterized protein J3R85_002624 [Psidium guajava]|nr:uncharacterized protein J3R85_002624 [Psidium guajava]